MQGGEWAASLPQQGGEKITPAAAHVQALCRTGGRRSDVLQDALREPLVVTIRVAKRRFGVESIVGASDLVKRGRIAGERAFHRGSRNCPLIRVPIEDYLSIIPEKSDQPQYCDGEKRRQMWQSASRSAG